MRFVSLLVVGALAAPAFAQLTAVAPNGYAAIQGNTNNAYPWNQGSTSTHVQFVYDSSHFTLQGINGPVLINRLRYRPAATVGSWAGGSWPNVRIDLATCPVDFLAVSGTYAANLGPDVTTVHQGQVVVLPGSGTSPTAWHIDIPLTTPFLYDPTSGDLTVDIQLDGTGWSGSSTQADHVSAGSPPALGSRIFNTTSATAPTGTVGTNYVAVCEFGYANPGGGPVATNATLGQGCVSGYASIYESFATSAAFDLANTGITWLPSGGSYIVLPGITTYVPPSAAATTVTLTDDSQAQVTLASPFNYPGGSTTALTVCSNGFVSVATGNGTGYSPAASAMLTAPQTGWWNWHDYNPGLAGSGQVKFEQSGGVAYVTYDGIWDFGGTSSANANFFQFQFDSTTGAVHLLFQTISSQGNNRLVGYSPGGNSADPGSTDISAVLTSAITLAATDVLPLRVVGQTRPIVNTSWNLQVSNVPASGTIGLDIFGLTDPGIVDLGFLGAPGCGSRASLDYLNAWLVAGSTHAYSLAIPNNPALLTMHVFTQAAVLQPGVNTLLGGIITSNGIDGTLGSQ